MTTIIIQINVPDDELDEVYAALNDAWASLPEGIEPTIIEEPLYEY